MSGITGFDIDNQRIAKQQVQATQEVAEELRQLNQNLKDLILALRYAKGR